MPKFRYRISRLFRVTVNDHYEIEATDEEEAFNKIMETFQSISEASKTIYNNDFVERKVDTSTMFPIDIDDYNGDPTEELYMENPENKEEEFLLSTNDMFYEQEQDDSST